MSLAVRWYIFVAIAAAFVIAVPAAWTYGRDPLHPLVLCVLMVAMERLTRIEFARRITISVSLVVAFAAMALLPPPTAATIGLVGGTQSPVSVSKLKTVFNIAMQGLVMASGSFVCGLLGGHTKDAAEHFPSYFLPFFAGVAASWLVNGLLLAGALSLSRVATFRSVVSGDMVRWALPYYGSSVLALIFVVLWQQILWFTALLVIVPMYASHWVFSQYSREQKAYEATVGALVQAVEIKDHYTRGHSERVAKGAELIARRLALPEDRIAKLRYAGLLHDIGKLGIPTRLLAKPGKLTDEEFAVLARHPNQGVAVIRDIRFLTDVYDGILYHHERLDGRGYPTGKSGDQIPLFARVLGVADAFDAMTSTRSYRAARPVAEAVEELRRGAGTQFDPELVTAFAEALELEERAGHPWQVTDEPVRLPDGAAEAGPPAETASAYTFEDHDDPQVERAWLAERDAGPETVSVEVLGVVRREPVAGHALPPGPSAALPPPHAAPAALEPLPDRGEDAPTAELFLFPSGRRHKGFAPRLPVDRRREGAAPGGGPGPAGPGPQDGFHGAARPGEDGAAAHAGARGPEPLPRRLDPADGNYHDLRHVGKRPVAPEPAKQDPETELPETELPEAAGPGFEAVVPDREATS